MLIQTLIYADDLHLADSFRHLTAGLGARTNLRTTREEVLHTFVQSQLRRTRPAADRTQKRSRDALLTRRRLPPLP